MSLFGYTWVSFGLEAASWRLRDIFTVLLWPPTTTSVQRCLVPWRGKPCFRSRRVSGLGWLHRSVAGWRIALNTYSVLLWRCSSDLRDISQSYCVSRRRQAGSTGQQSPGRRIATGGPSESVVSDRMAARARQLIRLAPGRGRGRQVAG